MPVLPRGACRFGVLVAAAAFPMLATAPTTLASPFSPATLDANIQSCLADIDPDSLFSYMNQLAAFVTRHTNSDTTSSTTGVGAARRWVFDKFVEFANQGGNITASYHNYTNDIQGITMERRNVVGEIPGTAAGSDLRVYVIGGHLDSRNNNANDAVGPAPGVDDDASGVACCLELARVMSLKSWPMTIRFIAFTGEEQGLFGSNAYAEDLVFLGQSVAAMLNNDTMASINGAPHPDSTVTTDSTLSRVFADGPEEGPHRQMQRYLKAMGDAYVPIQDIVIIPEVDRPGRGGDHQSFNAFGFTAIRYMEHNERVDLQHTPFDTMGVHLDKHYVRRNAQVDLATLANLMESPAPPSGLSVGDIGDSSGFRLEWPSTNTEPDLSGYLVTMRSVGALDYETVFDVGLVNELTVVSPPSDSMYFGLSIKDMGDHHSLITHEVLGVLSSVPAAPLQLTATPALSEINLTWLGNAEGDLDGYNVYRSNTSGSGYVQLNGSLVTTPSYDDATAVPGTFHYYVVTAVDLSANESGLSNEAEARMATLDSGILLVNETENYGQAWFPSVVASDSVYQNMLSTLPHDTWTVFNQGLPTLSDIGIYSSVIWAADDFNRTLFNQFQETQELKSAVSVLSDYMDLGGNVMTAGWEGTKGIKTILDYPLDPEPGDFLHDYFGIDAVERKLEAAFDGGLGQGFFPTVTPEPTRLRAAWAGELIRVEHFTALTPTTKVGYLYQSDDPDSAYHLQPCAAFRDGGGYRTVYWGFPLYHLSTTEARAALEAAMTYFGELPSTGAPVGAAGLSLALGQNRPNPFRGETAISFTVPGKAADIHLAIYDLAGRRVRTLISGRIPGGVYTESWRGVNEAGRRVASGVYFYRLQGEDRTLTKKLVLLR